MLLASQHLREQTGRRHTLLTGRAAAGLWAALRALGLQNQPVGIPANTCYIVLWAVLDSGSIPVLLDTDQTGNVSLTGLNSSPQLSAIIPTHLYGLPAPMETICDWAKRKHVIVIEDAAQAVGALVDNQPAGAWGDMSVFSFGPGKIIDVEGGGALLADDTQLAREAERLLASTPLWNDPLASLTDQWNEIYWALHRFETRNPALPGLYPQFYNIYRELIAYRLPPSWWTDLPDALRDLPASLQQRSAVAALYDTRLNHPPLRTLPRPAGAALWRYPLIVPAEQRDGLLRHLWQNHFYEVTRWYPSLRPMLAALRPDLPLLPTPAADALSAAVVNLPVGTDEPMAARLAEAVKRFFD